MPGWMLGRIEMVVLLLQQENALVIELRWIVQERHKGKVASNTKYFSQKKGFFIDSPCHPH